MKNKLANLGFALSRDAQKQIIGGEVIEIIDGTVDSGHVDPLFRDIDPSVKKAINVRAR